MNVLLVADLHYTLQQYDWLQQVAAEFDAVVIAGDLLEVASPVPREGQMIAVLKHLEALQKKTFLMVCSGNHDLTGRNEAGEKSAVWMREVRNLNIPCDGQTLTQHDLTISICPWWDGPHSQKQVLSQLTEDAQQRQHRWVWVYHAPPEDTSISCVGNRTVGDSVLREWIGQFSPDAVLCGHIHNAPFLQNGSWIDRIGKTIVLNPGKQIGAVPSHIILDTTRMEASWHSLMGTTTAPLQSSSDGP